MAKNKKTTRQVVQVVADPAVRAARNKRRRQRRTQNRASIAKAARTTPRKMQKWPTTRDGANFLRGALDPFSDVSLRSVGVPDTFAGDTLKHCNTMEITVVPDANGNIAFTILPSASNPLVVTAGTYKAVAVPLFDKTSHAKIGSRTTDLDATAVAGAGVFNPSIQWPTWANSTSAATVSGPGSATFGPYSYKSQRVISQGLEWRYTGTELNDQGVCTAAILDGYVLDGYMDKPANPTGVNTSESLVFVTRADVGNVVSNSQAFLSNQPRFVQQTLHTAEGSGGMLVLVSAEEGFVLKPTNPRAAIIEAGQTLAQWADATNGNAIATYGLDNTAVTPLVVLDSILPWQNLRPVGVRFTGLNKDTCTITLRLKQRVEATVTSASAFQEFTDKSPVEDQNAIDLVADIQKGLPVMVPVTMNGFGDWWRKIMSKIGSIGKIVGGMRIPMVSTVAGGVGDIAEILGSFADL